MTQAEGAKQAFLEVEIRECGFGSHPLFRDFHLRIDNRREIHGFLGRSGVGKTTLLRVIAGFHRHMSGSVRLEGAEIHVPGRAIHLMFQDYRLLPWRSCLGNIEFAQLKPDSRKASEWLERVGLAHRAEAFPKTMSGGEKARLALARAFASSAKLLLLDEPFLALDPVTRSGLHGLLTEVVAETGTGVCMVSHSIEDVVALSDVVHVLHGCPVTDARFSRAGERGFVDGGIAGFSSRITQLLAR